MRNTKAIKDIILFVVCLAVFSVFSVAHASSVYDNNQYYFETATVVIADTETSGSVVFPSNPDRGKIIFATINAPNLDTDSTYNIGISSTAYQTGIFYEKTGLADNSVIVGFIGGASYTQFVALPANVSTKYWTIKCASAQSGAKTFTIKYFIDKSAPTYTLNTVDITIANNAASGSTVIPQTVFGDLISAVAVTPATTSSVTTVIYLRQNTTIDSNYAWASSAVAASTSGCILEPALDGFVMPLPGVNDSTNIYWSATAGGTQTGAKTVTIRYITTSQRGD